MNLKTQMMDQSSNKKAIDDMMKDLMPDIMDMIMNNKYPITLDFTKDATITLHKDGKPWLIPKDFKDQMKLFVNMYATTQDAKARKEVVSSTA